jgi:hypothetical protein
LASGSTFSGERGAMALDVPSVEHAPWRADAP